MLKVLFILYEPATSGQTAHVLSLVQGLNKDKYAITVVLPEHLQTSIYAFRESNVVVIPMRLGKLLSSWHTARSLFTLIREEDFNIVHIHSQEVSFFTRFVAWLAEAQTVIYTPQTIDIRRSNIHWLYRLAERVFSRITDVIVSVNYNDQSRLIEWGIPANKVVTIPNGIDLNLFAEPTKVTTLREAYGLDEDGKLVMQVGRLSEQKNPLAFVKGAALIAKTHPEVIFTLVGEGPLRNMLEKHIRELGLEGKVTLSGWQENAHQLMAAADIISLTSLWEGTPYAILEAMAWGRPVVATAVNGSSEIVKHGITGLLVQPGDVAGWAHGIIELLSDSSMSASMGRQGKKRVEQEYSLRIMMPQIEMLYAGV